jgi:hypothetical protein
MTARKLRYYFLEHQIVVVNEAPLSNILNNPEATGRVSLWGIELSPGTSHMRNERPSSHWCYLISPMSGWNFRIRVL